MKNIKCPYCGRTVSESHACLKDPLTKFSNEPLAYDSRFRYRREQKIKFICAVCHSEYIVEFRHLSVNESNELICGKCKRQLNALDSEKKKARLEKMKKTCLERYGVENPMQAKSIQEKAKQTCLEKYGASSPLSSKKVREKIESTCLEKYGHKYALRYGTDEFKDLMLKKYGNEYYNNKEKASATRSEFSDEKKQDIIAKRKATTLERLGVEVPAQSKLIRDKMQQTCLQKYGTKFATQSEAVKKKLKQTCLEKYGYMPGRLHTPENKKAMIEKYGTEFFAQTKYSHFCRKTKLVYDDEKFDSYFELEFYIWAKDNCESVKHEPYAIEYAFDGETFKYFPDFEVDGELFEVKGLQFFEDKDPAKKMVNPFDHSQDAKYEAKHQCMLSHSVHIITDETMYADFVHKKFTNDFTRLFDKDADFPYQDLAPNASDDDAIRYFHRSVYEAHKKGYKSPIEAWQDKDLVKKAALNRLKEVGHCEPKDIVRAFSVAKIAPKVSVFKASLAKKLVKSYLSECDTIVDPFSGFSGRMLGVAANGKTYAGKDLNEKHVAESNEIIAYKQLQNCSVIVEDILKKENVETYDALFTCPPYEDKENWNDSNDASKTCDEWIEICMQKYECKKYLFVVDSTEKYRSYVVNVQNNKSHFGQNQEYVVLIDRVLHLDVE